MGPPWRRNVRSRYSGARCSAATSGPSSEARLYKLDGVEEGALAAPIRPDKNVERVKFEPWATLNALIVSDFDCYDHWRLPRTLPRRRTWTDDATLVCAFQDYRDLRPIRRRMSDGSTPWTARCLHARATSSIRRPSFGPHNLALFKSALPIRSAFSRSVTLYLANRLYPSASPLRPRFQRSRDLRSIRRRMSDGSIPWITSCFQARAITDQAIVFRRPQSGRRRIRAPDKRRQLPLCDPITREYPAGVNDVLLTLGQ